ncbi:MAG: Lpg1974 family pore-forming outer membrane protein [Chlamydiia bacterium]
MILASFGLFAGIHADDKKMEGHIPKDCSSLCADRPGFDCDKEFDISAAAIYEQIRIQGGEVAFVTQSNTQALFPVNGAGVEQIEEFAWGFKVGAGYSGWNDSWRTSVKYTNFRVVSNSDNQIAYGSAYVPSIYANSFVSDQSSDTYTSFQNLQIGNNTTINNLVFSLGRPSIVANRVAVDTYYSIMASFLIRRQLQVYTNDVAVGGTALTSATQSYSAANGGFYQNYQKYTWWGVGPCFGMKGDYYVGKGISFYGDVIGGLEYGSSQSRTSTLSSPKTVGPGQEALTLNQLYQFAPAMNLELGLNWRYVFDEDQVRVSFQLAYESSYYFMVMRTVINNIVTRTDNGAGLGLQGVVLQGMLEF